VVTAADAATPPPPTVTKAVAPAPSFASVTRKAELRGSLRALFEDRAAYTRNAVISALGNAADLDAVTARLMKNQSDIGNALKPYWGDDTATKVTALLKEQVTLSLAVVKAAKSGGKGTLAAAKQKASDNAVAIGVLLNGANPNWQKTTMAEMLQKYLDLTMREVTARLINDWPADVKAYDERHAQALAFADTLADGISKQFPDKFAG